jgi:stage III sporulation protein AD
MSVINVALIGICGAICIVIVKNCNNNFATILSIAICILIFLYTVNKVISVVDILKELMDYVSVEDKYITSMIKIIGIAYICEFSADICKDSGYQALGNQVLLFGRINIMIICLPVVVSIIKTVEAL